MELWRKPKYIFVQILIMSIFLLANGVINQGATKVLDIRIHSQHTLEWCWAASSAAVIEYINGETIEDCQVLSAYDYLLGGIGRCCRGNPECLRAGYPGEIKRILTIFDIAAKSQSTPITYEKIIQEIDSELPVMIALWPSTTTAHVVVIAGYQKPDTVIIMNPMSDTLLKVPYSALIADWKWKDTILISR